MSPVEVEFFYFFPVVLALYWILPRRAPIQNAVLLAASYAFFVSWNPRLLAMLVAVTLANFTLARLIAARRVAAAGGGASRPGRGLFWLAVALNVAELVFFKYEGFFATSLNALLGVIGVPSALPILRVVVPVGLSFRALQNIGYLADVYLGREAGPASLLDFALFATFFPQMLAGPIARGSQMLPQYATARRPDPVQWSSGAATFLLGFALKAFAADALGNKMVNDVFARSAEYSASAHWLALVGFAFQVFADFGGYSLIAIGIGRLFGLELPMNFNFPFQSKSLPEFWRRWHITLNTWLFDYIFVPLTVSKGWFRGRMVAGFIVTFLISGLWHGAAWTFVLWGLLQALGLAAQYIYDQRYKALCRRDRKWVRVRSRPLYQLGAWAITQVFFVVTLIPFRAPTLAATGAFARALARSEGTRSIALTNPQLAAALAFVIAYCLVPTGFGRLVWGRFQSMPALARGVAYGLAIAFLLVFTPAGSGTFIYAQF